MDIINGYVSGSCQEHNTGALVYGTPYNEEYWMQKLAKQVADLLTKTGRFATFLNNPSWTLRQITDDSNAKKVKIHLALHSDAGSSAASGTTAFFHNGSVEGEKLAKAVYNRVAPLLPGKDRGVHSDITLYRTGLAELRDTNAISALIEVDFHTNPVAAKAIVDRINDGTLAKALAYGWCDYFGLNLDELLKPKTTKFEDFSESAFMALNTAGIEINERRFNDPIKRGEMFILLDRFYKAIKKGGV